MESLTETSDELRLRAHRLDDAAARLEGSLVMTVHCRADDHTWRGGLAVACQHDLEAVQRRLASLVASLRAESTELRRRAVAAEWTPP